MSKLLIPNWTAVPNYVLDAMLARLSKAALKVYLAVARKTYGYQKHRDAIPLTQLQEITGLGRAGVVRGVNELGSLVRITNGFLVINGIKRECNQYELNVDVSTSELVSKWNWFQNGTSPKTAKELVPPWNTQKKEDKRNKKSTESDEQIPISSASSSLTPVPNKENRRRRTPASVPADLQPIVSRVIARMNELAGTAYKPDSNIVLQQLVPRLKAGASETDCLAVVDDRWAEWGEKPEMRQHFNPETLFREGKFEKYLNTARMSRSSAKGRLYGGGGFVG